MAFHVTDLDLMKDGFYSLLENGAADSDGVTLLTTMFTTVELAHWLNDRQRRFIKDTGIIWTRVPAIAGVPQTTRYNLPSDWIETRHVSWLDANGITRSLTRSNTWNLDMNDPLWLQSPLIPVVFNESNVDNDTIELAPAPNDIGSFELLYIALTTLLDGSGVILSIPDEFADYILWGMLADAFAADGEGNDPSRAQWCEQRYQEGVELANILMKGLVMPAQPAGQQQGGSQGY